MGKDWKDRLGVVYSTNSDFKFENDKEEEPITIAPEKQNLKVSIDRKQRKGKTVTLVQNFIGNQDDIAELGKWLKIKCGTGGTVKDGEIILQGDFCGKVIQLLRETGYRVK
jgi:translation initiation factor 1